MSQKEAPKRTYKSVMFKLATRALQAGGLTEGEHSSFFRKNFDVLVLSGDAVPLIEVSTLSAENWGKSIFPLMHSAARWRDMNVFHYIVDRTEKILKGDTREIAVRAYQDTQTIMIDLACWYSRIEMLEELHALYPDTFKERAYGLLFEYFTPEIGGFMRRHGIEIDPSYLAEALQSKTIEEIKETADALEQPLDDLLYTIRMNSFGRQRSPVLHPSAVLHMVRRGFLTMPESDDIRSRLDKYAANIELWQAKVRRFPPIQTTCDPHYFRPQAFEAARKILLQEGYYDHVVDRYAFYAAALFGTEQRMLEYLERWGSYGIQSFHDIVQHIQLPEGKKVDLKLWADAVMQHGPSMTKLVKFADKVPVPVRSRDGRMFSLAATRDLVARFAYKNGAKHPELAKICLDHQVKATSFEQARMALENAVLQKNLPQITIDGKRFGMEGAVFDLLPANDPRGPFLGEIVDNCQSIGNVGTGCAMHGVMTTDGGFYVLRKPGDKIVAETWAWRGRQGELCFDSLEALKGHVQPDQWENLLNAFAEELTKDTRHDVTTFTVGAGGATPRALSLAFKDAATLAVPKNYPPTGYRDSTKRQMLVWKRK